MDRGDGLLPGEISNRAGAARAIPLRITEVSAGVSQAYSAQERNNRPLGAPFDFVVSRLARAARPAASTSHASVGRRVEAAANWGNARDAPRATIRWSRTRALRVRDHLCP